MAIGETPKMPIRGGWFANLFVRAADADEARSPRQNSRSLQTLPITETAVGPYQPEVSRFGVPATRPARSADLSLGARLRFGS